MWKKCLGHKILYFSFWSHSNLSLASEDAESPESILTRASGSFSDGWRTRPFDNRHSPEKPSFKRQGQQALQQEVQSSPASLSGSLTDIPVLLVNGSPQPDLEIQSPGPENGLIQTISVSNSKPFPLHSESQPSFKPSANMYKILWPHWHFYLVL